MAPVTTSRAVELCDWLATVTLPDGGLPFALPVADPAATAPFWANADPAESSLQLTAFVAGTAQRVAAHDPAVAGHPWLARATDYCLSAIDALDGPPFAIALAASVQLLDAVRETRPQAAGLLERLAGHIPPDGRVPVGGGAEGETMRAIDFRAVVAEPVLAEDLERLASEQRPDGGWTVDFESYSPAAELEWRGYATVAAVELLSAG